MIDPRYTGPDGAKRLEMLEELFTRCYSWSRRLPLGIYDVVDALYQDNERVDRLEQEREESFRKLDDELKY